MRTEDVTGGDTRAGLEAIRDHLAAAMALAEPNVIAQLAGRLQAVIEAIDALPPAEARRSKLDELAQRRADRRSTPAPKASASGGGGKARRGGSGGAS